MTLSIEYVPWTSLRPHWDNPHLGDVEAIVDSIVVNGVYRPIICAQDRTILSGHHLYEAIGEQGGGDVPVVLLPLDPTSPEAYRIMLGDNRVAALGSDDEGRLLEVLRELDALDGGLFGTGYLHGDIDRLDVELRRLGHVPLSPPSPVTPSPPRVVEPLPARQRQVLARGTPPPQVERRYLTLPFASEDHEAVTIALADHRDLHNLTDLPSALMHVLGITPGER